MAKVTRFMWVRSPRAGKLHVKYGAASEGYAKCGTFVAKGWHIIRSLWVKRSANRPVLCKRCYP
jgi:hypothetical protein